MPSSPAKNGFVFTYGRFNPPTKGHGFLFREIVRQAAAMNATPVIVVSHSNASKKNPLTAEEKMSVIKQVFPKVVVLASSPTRLIGPIVKDLVDKYGNKPGLMLLGSDRVAGMSFLKKIYGINISQVGENRNSAASAANAGPARSLKQISGTRTRETAMRKIAANYSQAQKRADFRFQSLLGNTLSSPEINKVMNDLSRRINALPAKTPPKKK